MATSSQLGMKNIGRSATAPSEVRSRLRIDWSRVKGQMEPGQNCAYNQTRECFLGLQVIKGDFTVPSLNEWMDTLTPNSGSGIWMVPFRGVLATQVHAPLDLIYLDKDCRVIDAVEFFPTFRVSPSSPPAASVLALPSHSIFTSQTQAGDRLMVCSAEEMEWLLDQAEPSETVPGTVTNAVQSPFLVRDLPKKATSPAPQSEDIQKASGLGVIREMPRRADAPAMLELPQLAVQPQPSAPAAAHFQTLAEPLAQPLTQPAISPAAAPAGMPTMPKRGWLFPGPADPRRKAPRLPVPGLTAHFFTGGAPQAHEIRDISATGLYVITTERWYPGTLIRMTLSKPQIGQAPSERSITVHAKAVRWGNDGVGLEFVVEAPSKRNKVQHSPFDPVDSAHLDSFLKRLTGPTA